ncbi:MAG: multicopper oxidase domain-containing protein, partial [Spirochaetales bacterium]|nr:multicopper oxidase domain-containing protein [Spirochaetales bacterium]
MNHIKSIIFIFIFLYSGIFAQGNSSPFSKELYIPPILESDGIERGALNYNLTVQTGEIAFFGNKTTPTLGFNGNYLGPTIRVKRGERVSIKV